MISVVLLVYPGSGLALQQILGQKILAKVCLSPLQSVLNAAARLIARPLRYSHISTFMFEQLHWLPLSARIEFKILILVFKAQRGLAPKYLADVLLRPLSASSHRPLRSSNTLELL